MDLTKMPNDKKLELCRWYFKAGFIFLPFIWAVNACWFFQDAFRAPEFDEQKQMKKYVIGSAIGASIWTVIIVTWVVLFQVNRAAWGEFADNISFIIPVGTP